MSSALQASLAGSPDTPVLPLTCSSFQRQLKSLDGPIVVGGSAGSGLNALHMVLSTALGVAMSEPCSRPACVYHGVHRANLAKMVHRMGEFPYEWDQRLKNPER